MKLLEIFKDLTVHPKNAQELKGLILQLAIQAKLTKKWREQNPNVQPASVLLKKIQEEKAQLIKEKKIKKENIPPVDLAEVYFNIPDSWVWERLGQIGFVFNGDSVNKSIKEAKYANLKEGFPYIATKDVGYLNDPINHDNGVKIPFNEPKFKVARKGTVLICSEGGSAGKKMGILEQDSCFGNKLYAIEQFGGIQSVYIQSIYGSESFGSAFKESMTGIIGGISSSAFKSLYVPLPPLEEQKAIVEIVNQLFTEVEALEEQTKVRVQLKEDFVTSALQQLTTGDTIEQWSFLRDHFKTFFTEKSSVKKLRESILQLAVQGKLTQHWRSENPVQETAAELLEKIKAEKAQLIKDKKIKKEKPLPEITEDEIPYELPEDWVWCRLGEVVSLKSGQDLKPSEYSDKEDFGLPYITGASNLKDEKVIINRWTNAPRSLAKKGDLLLTCKGSGVGKMGWLHVDSAHIARQIMALDTFLSPLDFVKIIMDVNAMTYRRNANGLIPGIDRNTVLYTLIAFPPSEEQQTIVTKVNALMALCDALEQEIENSTNQVEQLMQSCLREVFEGADQK
ncbi:restriction endonuclease subunit S [Fulvivirga lutea]|uniref:Restriction endonuclease subunit S n=1 Tax=Fulvivirga lutea TaxID=2810512 RepID=A0A974WE29_9BACT|nr:restriction endonuclease subunit S [Fulvivirga lutea]QSE96553.1 restriction endonuclease subunit S [Fulvivirga lutea]